MQVMRYLSKTRPVGHRGISRFFSSERSRESAQEGVLASKANNTDLSKATVTAAEITADSHKEAARLNAEEIKRQTNFKYVSLFVTTTIAMYTLIGVKKENNQLKLQEEEMEARIRRIQKENTYLLKENKLLVKFFSDVSRHPSYLGHHSIRHSDYQATVDAWKALDSTSEAQESSHGFSETYEKVSL